MQRFSDYIVDNMVYALVPKKKHQKRLAAAENYRILGCKVEDAPIQLPPKNSSYETKLELEELLNMQSQYPKADKLEQKYDDDFLWAFEEFCLERGLAYDKKYFEDLVDEAASISIRLKYKFNRPRPNQLARVHGLDINKFDSETAKTPSFPSGHTAQSQTVALVLAKMYPEYKEDFQAIADEVSLSRLVGHHHFPSDIAYGQQLGVWMAQSIQ
jgi:hypothetical protein